MKQLILDIFRIELSVMIELNLANIVCNKYVIITSKQRFGVKWIPCNNSFVLFLYRVIAFNS